jgi:hypothetical protein
MPQNRRTKLEALGPALFGNSLRPPFETSTLTALIVSVSFDLFCDVDHQSAISAGSIKIQTAGLSKGRGDWRNDLR